MRHAVLNGFLFFIDRLIGNSAATRAAIVILKTEISSTANIFQAAVKLVTRWGERADMLKFYVCIYSVASKSDTLIEIVACLL